MRETLLPSKVYDVIEEFEENAKKSIEFIRKPGTIIRGWIWMEMIPIRKIISREHTYWFEYYSYFCNIIHVFQRLMSEWMQYARDFDGTQWKDLPQRQLESLNSAIQHIFPNDFNPYPNTLWLRFPPVWHAIVSHSFPDHFFYGHAWIIDGIWQRRVLRLIGASFGVFLKSKTLKNNWKEKTCGYSLIAYFAISQIDFNCDTITILYCYWLISSYIHYFSMFSL